MGRLKQRLGGAAALVGGRSARAEPAGQAPYRDVPDGEDVSEQPYRECLAAPLALEAAARVLNPKGRFGLLRNDAEAAIAALRKGSTQSAPMQRSALLASRLCARLDLDSWHVPGMQLVEEGVDGALRQGRHFGEDANPESVIEPAVADDLWGRIRAAAEGVGSEVTVDAFATELNRRARWFWSRFGEPGSEAEDALSVRDWGKSRCPGCGCWHRELVYAFPPTGLIRHVVRKAVADSVVWVLVVPMATTATHWSKLVRYSLLSGKEAPDGFLRVRAPGGAAPGRGKLRSERAGDLCVRLRASWRRPGS